MLLTIDVGNTNIEFGIYEDTALKGTFRLMTKTSQTSDEIGLLVCEYFRRFDLSLDTVEDVIIASVVPGIMYSLKSAMIKYLGKKPLVVNEDVFPVLGFLGKASSKDLGADRSVACMAAAEKYGLPLVVLDFGTATTVDAVDENGVYLGGCISAGLRVTMDALVSNAAMLPNVELKKPDKLLSFTVTGHIQAGVVGGYVGAMEYLISHVKEEMGCPDVPVVATGGLARVIADHTPLINVVDGSLVPDGLRMIYEEHHK